MPPSSYTTAPSQRVPPNHHATRQPPICHPQITAPDTSSPHRSESPSDLLFHWSILVRSRLSPLPLVHSHSASSNSVTVTQSPRFVVSPPAHKKKPSIALKTFWFSFFLLIKIRLGFLAGLMSALLLSGRFLRDVVAASGHFVQMKYYCSWAGVCCGV